MTATPAQGEARRLWLRVWTYGDWDGRRLLLSSDEYDRRTLLIRLWGTRAVVFALPKARTT